MVKKFKLKKGDNVVIIAGKDKGKTGEILSVSRASNRVLVQGVNVVKRHTKPSQTTTGGIIEQEKSIHMSNVAFVDPKSNKQSKIGFKFLQDGRKVRFSRSSGEVVDA